MINKVIKKIILVIAIGIFLPFFLSAQQKNEDSTQNPTVSKQAARNDADEEEVDPDDVEIAANKVIDKLRSEKDSNPVPVTLLMSYSNKFVRFSKYPRIETDTRISVLWYKNVSESLSNLAGTKRMIETARFNKEEKQLEELHKAYRESVAKIIYLLEHPQKKSDKK